ncbi:hypothetical protein ACIRA2_22025 [Streptomyces griseoviridis]
MSEQKQGRRTELLDRRQRRVRVGVFVGGVVVALVFFGFFPGMPHVIDWGAILVSLAVGAFAQWGWGVWRGGRRGS